MALPYPISASQTDAKSPVDDNLLDSIRLNLDYLDNVVTSGGVPVYAWNLNGKLNYLPGRIAKRLDMQFLHSQQAFSRCRIAQEVSGESGVTEIDIRYHSKPKTPITAIAHKFQANTTSIAQIAPAIATQSIVRATAQVSTQSITRAKATLSVLSIIDVGTNLWRYNLSAAPDADYQVGDSILTAGCTTPANNGTFAIVEVNQSGHPSIVVTNASGAAQNAAAGTLDLQCWSYNLVNPANSAHTPGELAIFASHTNANNNGNKTIYKVNEGGNNIWVKNATGVAQASTPGTIDTSRWIYSYSTAVPSDFVVGEKVRFASHTTGANNGDFEIKAANSGGNNIIISNASGVAQGAAAGNANTLRWKYSFGSDPSTNVQVGDSLVMASHTNANNNGTFTVVQVNNLTANNVVIYNALGVAQAGAVGNVTHTDKVVSFSSDQSLIYSTDSYVELMGCPDSTYNMNNQTLPYKVKEVNRGGGANYNIVIKVPTGSAQSTPAGLVAFEARSIFTDPDGSKPQLSTDLVALSPQGLLKAEFSGADISAVPVPANTYMGLYILQVQDGSPENLSVILS